jgi:hypothetical protein
MRHQRQGLSSLVMVTGIAVMIAAPEARAVAAGDVVVMITATIIIINQNLQLNPQLFQSNSASLSAHSWRLVDGYKPYCHQNDALQLPVSMISQVLRV